MTATVFLVRHGSHDLIGKVLCGRMEGVSLNTEGRQEAERLARRLQGEGIAAVYTSPLARARETAAPIAAALGRRAVVVEALNEIHFGAWTGARFAQLQGDPLWARWNTMRSLTRPPGGEGALEVQVRIVRWLELIADHHREDRVVAVTHGDVIKAGLFHVLGTPLDQHLRLDIAPASISTLSQGEWGAKILHVNEVVS